MGILTFNKILSELGILLKTNLLRIFECRGVGDSQVLRKGLADLFSDGVNCSAGFDSPERNEKNHPTVVFKVEPGRLEPNALNFCI
jgi:hypothetical protein